MQAPTKPKAAPKEDDKHQATKGKRKLQQQQQQQQQQQEHQSSSTAAAAPSTSTTNTKQQQSISDHFAPPSRSSPRGKTAGTVSSTPKRQKPNPPSPPRTSTGASHTRHQSSTSLTPEQMYSFSSNRPSAVVDLTGSSPSPTSSPAPRRQSTPRRPPTFNPHTGAKQLVVKNLRKAPRTDPREYFDQVWAGLDAALNTIFNEEQTNFSLETLYRGVENVCRQGHAKELTARLNERSTQYMVEGLKGPLLERASASNVDVLRDVLRAWGTWNKQQVPVRWIFCYLDRSYLLQQGQTLQEQSIDLFRSLICEDPVLKGRIVMGACDLVEADRNGDSFMDQTTFRDTISMFHDLGVYTSMLEPKLLEHSQKFIVRWAEQNNLDRSLAESVNSVVRLIDSEMSRCELFGLDASTRRDLLTLLEDHLIQQPEKHLVSREGVAGLLNQNAVHDLEQLYELLERRRLGSKLRPAFERWINDTGTAIVFDEKEQDSMVVRLLTLKKQLDTIWRVSFQRNPELGHGLRESFEAFINKQKKTTATWNTDNSKPGEMIAKYVDMLLRGGAKKIPAQLSLIAAKQANAEEEDVNGAAFDEDSEINNQLDQVLDLFRFVHGKAVFEAFYKKDLARRLLMGRSASADAERSMLARLKTECGAGFTQNLEQMFKDVELASEEMSSYKAILEARGERPPVDLSVNILSSSAWPTYPDVPVRIPSDIKNAIDAFTAHYKSKHSGRKLDWKHALAHCQIRAAFPKGNKELVVSSFQAVVLLLFNSVAIGEHVSYDFLAQETQLPAAELNRTLQSLACALLRPLTKHPKGRDIKPTDTFTYNAAFSHDKLRLKINQVQLKETKQENKETHERVAADRNFETQAAIVRIMKSRKRIGHAELVAEVISATRKRGVLSVADIKKNVDRLVDKDYIEREENNEYSYLA